MPVYYTDKFTDSFFYCLQSWQFLINKSMPFSCKFYGIKKEPAVHAECLINRWDSFELVFSGNLIGLNMAN